MNNALIVTSPTSDSDKTQAGVVYLSTAINMKGLTFDVLDLSGQIDYFDPPEQLFTPHDSKKWLNSGLFAEETWLDGYFDNNHQKYDYIFYSALFSPDILVHCRHALKQRELYQCTKTVIGGAAVAGMNNTQLGVLAEIFDFVCVGFEIDKLVDAVVLSGKNYPASGGKNILKSFNPPGIEPNYGLINAGDFMTVYSGHGCRYGKCGFCNSRKCAGLGYFPRNTAKISRDFKQIADINPNIKDVMLSSDSLENESIRTLSAELKTLKTRLHFNFMLRGESWIDKALGQMLPEAGCTDVFIGVEALDDDMLAIIRKGLGSKELINAIKTLSSYVKVAIGMIFFLPGANKKRLQNQLEEMESLLPFISGAEPEVLSVVQGSALADNPEKYGIQLWAKHPTINDSWCFGFSPDIPWTFKNPKEIDLWADHYRDMKNLLSGIVAPHYWDSIEYVFNKYQS